MVQSNERILVVDDDAPIREIFVKALSRIGYHCEVAESADAADLALLREEFALMLLEIDMPGKSGLTLLPELIERHPDMAIVMITGTDAASTSVLTMQEGAIDYIVKPVPVTQLVFRVINALKRRSVFLENKTYRERLERMVGQSRQILAAVNTLTEAYMALEESTPEIGLQSAVTELGSGLKSLANLAEGLINEAPDARRPG